MGAKAQQWYPQSTSSTVNLRYSWLSSELGFRHIVLFWPSAPSTSGGPSNLLAGFCSQSPAASISYHENGFLSGLAGRRPSRSAGGQNSQHCPTQLTLSPLVPRCQPRIEGTSDHMQCATFPGLRKYLGGGGGGGAAASPAAGGGPPARPPSK